MLAVQTRYQHGITIRPLANGDVDTVSNLFARLGSRSREQRFCGAKPRLSERELARLARVDGSHHVLVGYVSGDALPVGMARLVRHGDSAEIAFEVADDYQGQGVGSVLARTLADDARAAGITSFFATVYGDNPGVVSLLTRIAESLHVRWQGGEREIVVGLGS
jgi:ribosomal protein S18 acetylase RimI-like enzyme